MERIEYEKNYLKEVMARIQEEITAQNQSLIEIPNQYKNR